MKKGLPLVRQALLWGNHTTIQPTVICVGNDDDGDVRLCKSCSVL